MKFLLDIKEKYNMSFSAIILLILLLVFLSYRYFHFTSHDFITIHGIMPKGSVVEATVNYVRQIKSDGSCGKEKHFITGFTYTPEIGGSKIAEVVDETHYRVKLALRKKGEGCIWRGYSIKLVFDNKNYDFPIDKYGLNILDSHRKMLSLSGIITHFYINDDIPDSKDNELQQRQLVICNVIYSFSGRKNNKKYIRFPYSSTMAQCYDNKTENPYEKYAHGSRFSHNYSLLMKDPAIRLDFALNPNFMCSGDCPEYIQKDMKLSIKPDDKEKIFPDDDLYQQLLKRE